MRRKPVRSSEKKILSFPRFLSGSWIGQNFNRQVDTSASHCCGEMSEDLGGAVMGRGGRSADPQRLASFMQSMQDWSMEQDGPLEEHQFQSEEESVDDGDDGNQRLLPTQYGDNSPSKGPTKRKGGTTSAVWKVIKRLTDRKLLPPTPVHARVCSDSDSDSVKEAAFRFRFSSVRVHTECRGLEFMLCGSLGGFYAVPKLKQSFCKTKVLKI